MMPTELAGEAFWLPLIFMGLMGVSILAYVILDGYDLGVGILLPTAANVAERDLMIASIGPFWDANETWLVLGVGILLVAFPMAHGVILTNLYLPVVLMLIGLTLRGVAFEFRVKARSHHQYLWDHAFFVGSLTAAVAQGVMLGRLITGFEPSAWAWLFALGIGVGLAGGYTLLGAGWLIMKTENALQRRAVRWGRRALMFTAAGIAAVSMATPLVSPQIFAKWFSLDTFFALLPIPLTSAALVVLLTIFFRRLADDARAGNRVGLGRWSWAPFAGSVGLFMLAFLGFAYSLFPWLVLDRITLWDAASAPESLRVILWGVVIVVPTILGYTAFVYRVFWGKAQPLTYSG
jgi:cytochrome bd ubiquinol oxidase subunit II